MHSAWSVLGPMPLPIGSESLGIEAGDDPGVITWVLVGIHAFF